VVEWKRITDIFPDAKFVAEKINPSDIVQGKIGDCYFLCAIAALAENDFRIKNLFPNLEMNPWGIYMARILHRGMIQ
jgi:calpain-15